MARSGVTQDDVSAAADKLLHSGERPTIERVRTALGTGSPNTLIRLLDVWWTGLGARLRAQETKLALPAAPSAVVEAASTLWIAALEHATALANAALQIERTQLAAAQEDLVRGHETMKAESLAAMDATQRACDALVLVEARCSDLQRLTSQQEAQLEDLKSQRDRLAQDRIALTERVDDVIEQRDRQAAAALAERQALEAQHRATEDRWLQEVDRARQEAAQLHVRLVGVEKENGGVARRATEQTNALQKALRAAELDQIAQATRVTALEAEIARWHQRSQERTTTKVAPTRERRASPPRKKSVTAASKGRQRAKRN